jgi:hypothetical protein
MKPGSAKRANKRYGLMLIGYGAVAVSVGAAFIEGWRNFAYGWQDGPVYAFGYLLFAAGLIISQLVGRYYGWLAAAPAIVVCGVMTWWCGFGYYSDAIKAGIQASEMTRTMATASTKDAAADDALIADLEARLARIGETATSAGLRETQRIAQERVARETTQRGGCPATVKREGKTVPSECAKAEAEATEAARRLVDAEAREGIERRLAEARQRRTAARTTMQESTAQQKGAGIAFILSWLLGGDEGEYRRRVGLFEPVATMIGQLILAALFSPGMWLIAKGRGVPMGEQPEQPKPARREPRPATKTGRPKMTAAERVAQWAAEALQPTEGADASSARLRELFDEWKAKRCPDLERVTANAFAAGLNAAGYENAKIGGVARYRGVTIKGETPPKSPAKRPRKRRQVATAPQPAETAEPVKKHLH